MRHILLWCGAFIGVIVVFAIAAVAIGMNLPVKHVVSRRKTFSLPAAKLWNLSLGVFHRMNKGIFVIVEQEPPRRLVTAISGKNLPFGGTWTYEFAGTGMAPR